MSTPIIPSDLEDVVLLKGPILFRDLVREAGGVSSAANICDCSKPTISRWLSSEPGSTFGSPKLNRTYRSIWFGYPGPFPGLDRITETLIGQDISFLSHLETKIGFRGVCEFLESSENIDLSILEFPDRDLHDAATEVGIPRTTRNRWISDKSLPYPHQWRKLDALSGKRFEMTWLEFVLQRDPSSRRQIPPAALACFIDEVRLGRISSI